MNLKSGKPFKEIHFPRNILRHNFMFYLLGILIMLGLKYYYSQADADSLLWILSPTVFFVERLSGIPFSYQSGAGYVNHSLRLLIAPSCSGVQFMIVTFATLLFSFVHIAAAPEPSSHRRPQPFRRARENRILRGLGWTAASLFLSWFFTVIVNSLRIITAIYLPVCLERAGLMNQLLSPDRLHTLIGVTVYFTSLLTIYGLTEYLMSKKREDMQRWQNRAKSTDNGHREPFPATFLQKCLPPVFWYFAITLGLPFLHRAYIDNGARFTEFALLVICCATLVLLLYELLLLVCSGRKYGHRR